MDKGDKYCKLDSVINKTYTKEYNPTTKSYKEIWNEKRESEERYDTSKSMINEYANRMGLSKNELGQYTQTFNK